MSQVSVDQEPKISKRTSDIEEEEEEEGCSAYVVTRLEVTIVIHIGYKQ